MLRPADCAQVQLNNSRVQLLKQAMESLSHTHTLMRAFFLSLSILSVSRRNTHMDALGELGVQCLA